MRIRDWSSDVCSSDLRLSRPHQSMINEYTGKLVTNGLRDQNGRYGAIDPARQSAYDPSLAHLSPDLLNFCLPEFRHAPIASKAANMACKIGDQPAPIGCVDHLGMKLHPVKFAFFVSNKDRKSTRLNSSH